MKCVEENLAFAKEGSHLRSILDVVDHDGAVGYPVGRPFGVM
jgi:hypothetical protein